MSRPAHPVPALNPHLYTTDRLAVNLGEAAELIGLSRWTFQRLVSAGKGPVSLRIGNRRLFLVDDLRLWLEAYREVAA